MWGNRIIATGLLLSIRVLTGARCVVLTGCIDTRIACDRLSAYTEKRKSSANKLKFVVGDEDSRDSERAIILQIWVGNRFRPVRLRLAGGSDKLPCMGEYYWKPAYGGRPRKA